jgi:hypothetical protein
MNFAEAVAQLQALAASRTVRILSASSSQFVRAGQRFVGESSSTCIRSRGRVIGSYRS